MQLVGFPSLGASIKLPNRMALVVKAAELAAAVNTFGISPRLPSSKNCSAKAFRLFSSLVSGKL